MTDLAVLNGLTLVQALSILRLKNTSRKFNSEVVKQISFVFKKSYFYSYPKGSSSIGKWTRVTKNET